MTQKIKSFNTEQINAIKLMLASFLNDDCCMPKKTIFSFVKKSVEFEIELYQFEKMLTFAINSNIIQGYSIKQGRNGGVCKKDFFPFIKNNCRQNNCRQNKKNIVRYDGKIISANKSQVKLLKEILDLGIKDNSLNIICIYIDDNLYSFPEKIDTNQLVKNILARKKNSV